MQKITSALLKKESYINLIKIFVFSIIFFTFGIGVFFTVVVGISFTLSLVTAVFTYKLVDLDIGSYKINTFSKALFTSIASLPLFLLLMTWVNKVFDKINNNVFIRIGKFEYGKIPNNSKRTK